MNVGIMMYKMKSITQIMLLSYFFYICYAVEMDDEEYEEKVKKVQANGKSYNIFSEKDYQIM